MAIEKEQVKAILPTIDDSEVDRITGALNNVFENTIGKRIGEVHGQYDEDIKEILGKERPQGVKTYEWLKSELKTLKEVGGKSSEYQSKIKDLEDAKSELQKKLEGKGDEATQAEIQRLQKAIADERNKAKRLSDQIAEVKGEYEGKLSQSQQALQSFKAEQALAQGLVGLKFKPEEQMSKEVRDAFIRTQKATILAQYKIDEKDGQMILRDSDDQIVLDMENGAKAYTPAEFFAKQLQPILDGKREASGGGAGAGEKGKGGAMAFADAKSQAELLGAIKKHLQAQGIPLGTKFIDKQTELFNANNGKDLPTR